MGAYLKQVCLSTLLGLNKVNFLKFLMPNSLAFLVKDEGEKHPLEQLRNA